MLIIQGGIVALFSECRIWFRSLSPYRHHALGELLLSSTAFVCVDRFVLLLETAGTETI